MKNKAYQSHNISNIPNTHGNNDPILVSIYNTVSELQMSFGVAQSKIEALETHRAKYDEDVASILNEMQGVKAIAQEFSSYRTRNEEAIVELSKTTKAIKGLVTLLAVSITFTTIDALQLTFPKTTSAVIHTIYSLFVR